MGFNNIFKMVLATTLLSSGSSSQLYNLVATTIQGEQVDFGGFEGRVVLMVNVASQCGYTDGHYRGLQRLHDILGQDGKLEILGFPCNQFGGQEPRSAGEVEAFVQSEFGVEFRMMEKVEVEGPGAHPVWKYLTGSSGVTPTWNFFKYLVDHNGDVIQAWGPQTSVEDIFDSVQSALRDADTVVQVESPLQHYHESHDEL